MLIWAFSRLSTTGKDKQHLDGSLLNMSHKFWRGGSGDYHDGRDCEQTVWQLGRIAKFEIHPPGKRLLRSDRRVTMCSDLMLPAAFHVSSWFYPIEGLTVAISGFHLCRNTDSVSTLTVAWVALGA